MLVKWLNAFLRFSGLIFSLKQKIVESKGWARALPYAVLLLFVELAFLVVSLPVYMAVSPKKLQEKGFIFPKKFKESAPMHAYVVRRRISLAAIFGAGGVYCAKVAFVGIASLYLLGPQALLAAAQDWDFSAANEYAYDGGTIEVTGGVARLKATTVSVSSSTVSGFDTGVGNWTYADWLQPSQTTVSGAYQSSGGNPGGHIDVSLTTTKKNKTMAGMWTQPIVLTTASPDAATLSFDWRSSVYDSSNAPVTYQLYAFVSASAGNPTLGQQVWASGEISGTTNWASVANIDLTSVLTAAGTYYVKLAAYADTPKSGNAFTYVSNFDNVAVNWSKTSVSYDATSPSIAPVVSLVPGGVTSWNAFTETATLNEGTIQYQLSSDDGTTWMYWNGSAWAAATTSSQSNTASVINANIATFSYVEGRILWNAFLIGNGTQQVILDNVAVGYSQNVPPNITGVSAAQQTATGYVKVDYALQDANSDPISLIHYEYSLTGAFAGEQATMTPASDDPSHDGVSGLTSSPAGVAHTFVWNAKADLGNASAVVYVRLRANDGFAESAYATASAASVDGADPVVSNMTAVVASGTSDIHIVYDLADDTMSNLTVDIQASSDDGATWTVPVSTASGDIGSSVAVGTGNEVVWLAGTDYPNQEQDEMRIRVRAKDAYQNQGEYVTSTRFILDNKAPVVETPADLLAQPNAGEDHVLLGGSFSEGHPNTNDFYVNINGDGYGALVAGDADTATPSNMSVPAGKTFVGTDRVEAVKIVHTDDYGYVTANENVSPNAAYRYVKPYTPPGPMVGNPGEGSLDVTIQKHALEAPGLEYAVYEESQNLYVQSDDTLGASPAWMPVGTMTVTGLTEALETYVFRVKSRNTSDTSHAATSESGLSSGTSLGAQAPQVAIDSVAQTTDGTKVVVIQYTGIDGLNEVNDLVTYEYSQDGTDWRTMTEKTGGASDGVTDLPFSATGIGFTFAWDVGLDLSNTEDATVYVRLASNNGTMDSNMAVSPAFTVDTAGPVISSIDPAQTPQSEQVVIAYDLADAAGSNMTVDLGVSDDGGSTYAVSAPSVTGHIGTGVTAGVGRQIVWDVGADAPDQENPAMNVRLTATDSFGNEGSPEVSGVFAVDTKDPVVSGVIASQTSGSGLVVVTYVLADASESTVFFDVSSDSGATWTVATATYTGDAGPGQTAGSNTFEWNAAVDYPDVESSTMRVRVRAMDAYGHVSEFASSADFIVNTKVLSISGITAIQGLGGTLVTIRYDLNRDATIRMDISSDGGSTWSVATSTATGHVDTFVVKGNGKSISWNPGIDLPNNEQGDMRIRLQGTDGEGMVSASYESDNFSVDTAGPLGLLSLSRFAGSATSATMLWSSGVADAHFHHYALWHGSVQMDVADRAGTAVEWGTADDPDLADIATMSTVITGLDVTADYYVKLWAIDAYGNESTTADVNIFNPPDMKTLTVSSTAGGTTDPAPGSYLFSVNSVIPISGIEDDGYRFVRWEEDGAFVSDASDLSVLLDQDRSFTAFFEAEPVVPPTEELAEGVGSSGGWRAGLDMIPPAKPILVPPTSPTNVLTVLVSGLAEAGSLIDLYDNGVLIRHLDVAADTNGQFSQEVSFAEGSHALTVHAVDNSGNVSEASEPVTVIVKTTPPAAPIVLTPKTGDRLAEAMPEFIGVAEPFARIELTVDTSSTFAVLADIDGAWRYRLPSDAALRDGLHTFVFTAVDTAGNRSAETRLEVTKAAPPSEAIPVIPETPPAVVAPLPPSGPPPSVPVSPSPSAAPAVPPPPVPGLAAEAPLESMAPIVRESARAVELPGVPVPVVGRVEAFAGENVFAFSGSALPNQDVIVYIHSDQALAYHAKADANGVWRIRHSQDAVELAPGIHTVYAVALDPDAGVKSRPGIVQTFTVSKNFWVSLFQRLNIQTTFIALMATLAIMLWLSRIQRRERLQIA